MDSSNQFLVGMNGENLRIVLVARLHVPITREQALNLAAWLAALADPSGEEFSKLRKEIEQS